MIFRPLRLQLLTFIGLLVLLNHAPDSMIYGFRKRKTQYISFDMRDISHIMYNIGPTPKSAFLFHGDIAIHQFNPTLRCELTLGFPDPLVSTLIVHPSV